MVSAGISFQILKTTHSKHFTLKFKKEREHKMNSEVIYTFLFLITSPIFSILYLESKRRFYLFLSIGSIAVYPIYVIYLMNKQEIAFIFLLHHMIVFLAMITPYFYRRETENEKDKRNKYLNRIVLILCLLIIFTIPKS